jgi:recombination protein RecR
VHDLECTVTTGVEMRMDILKRTVRKGPIAPLVTRVRTGGVREVILALNATVDGQTTAHYLVERLDGSGAAVTRLAHGVPVGGELDYLDDGTLSAALAARRSAG